MSVSSVNKYFSGSPESRTITSQYTGLYAVLRPTFYLKYNFKHLYKYLLSKILFLTFKIFLENIRNILV